MDVHSSRHPDSATMLVSRLRFPVRNIGYGIRAGIWLPGCRLFCRACLAENTWDFDEWTRCGVDAVLDGLGELPAGRVDGVTVYGREPTEQPAALRILLDRINEWRARQVRPADLLLYSGRSAATLDERFPWLIRSVDALVTGYAVAAEVGDFAPRDAPNRRIVIGSALGMRRYATAEFAPGLMSCDSCARPAPIADTTARTVGTGRTR
ncbi:anaerobic ribonucleoside-triphosphate reductase activating protein [Nocardia tenerifensis]|uniref:Anaerobic ribonucleoside-triphosphate reductase activating protein n=1 Tax=Nocardia tenerifensis TaxID=228006 RepID=A0A318KD95_9NOCA|nr:4Fe-4S cluster-binding domain-containing protein [Nocardia tenerifensis]PXX70729.1 anaerobic ribonucleoside-triphosphate reductase activating protein [Nocardia tenerifensis]